MKQEDTRQKILDKALELFAAKAMIPSAWRDRAGGRHQGSFALQSLSGQAGHFRRDH